MASDLSPALVWTMMNGDLNARSCAHHARMFGDGPDGVELRCEIDLHRHNTNDYSDDDNGGVLFAAPKPENKTQTQTQRARARAFSTLGGLFVMCIILFSLSERQAGGWGWIVHISDARIGKRPWLNRDTATR